MKETACMRRAEALRDVHQPSHPPRGRNVRVPEVGRERLALDVLHRDERDALDLAEVVHVHRVRVRELRGQACLAEEARHDLLLRQEAREEDLQRHLSMKDAVERQNHTPHPTASELDVDRVTAKRGARKEVHQRFSTKLRTKLLG
jgi:hypothetical protein